MQMAMTFIKGSLVMAYNRDLQKNKTYNNCNSFIMEAEIATQEASKRKREEASQAFDQII